MTRFDLTITLDGPAGSGKSTLAKGIAAHFKLPFLDTGLLYRAVARRMIDRDIDPNDFEGALEQARALQDDDLDESRLRGQGVGQWASAIAVNQDVRDTLLPFQQLFARRKDGAVLAGRDTGTVIVPDAKVKFYVEASVEARAERRFKELLSRGEETIYERVLAEVRERDERDEGRDVAPLRAAPDAIIFDTTKLDIEAALSQAIAEIERVIRAAAAGQR